MTSRLNIYLLVDHGVRIKGRAVISWQVVGQVDADRSESEKAARRRAAPFSTFETGTTSPPIPYGCAALSMNYGKSDTLRTSYRQGMDDG